MEFAINLCNSKEFQNQLYDHAASIFALLEQGTDTLLIHFDSLMSLGSITERLARQQNWDMDYIKRVQKMYKMEEYNAQKWFEPFNKYLEVKHEYKNAASFFKIILNDAIQPDQRFNLKNIKVATLPDNLMLNQEDIKMMTLSTEILNLPGTIFQFERTYTSSNQTVDNEIMSTVDEILSQVTSGSKNTSRAISIVNDVTQRHWNLSATDLPEDTDDESIILEVCEYFDGQAERICGAPLEAGQTRCPEHSKPEFNQPMELIRQLQEIEPGRAFNLTKDIIVEIPKPKSRQQAIYANSTDGDSKECIIHYYISY